jgi:hypothetical protein
MRPHGYKMSLIHSSKLSFLCFRVSLHSSKKKLLGVPPYLQVDPPHLQDEPQMIQAVFQQLWGEPPMLQDDPLQLHDRAFTV